MTTNQTNIPKHVAIIMDGNRRWAQNHKLQMFLGHKKGTEQIESIVEHAANIGIQHITFWAFSTENWRRSKTEVSVLMEVFRDFLRSGIPERFIKNGAKLRVLGEYKAFPKDIVEGMDQVIEKSKDNTKITVNIAINYGGRLEILSAVKQLLEKNISPESLNADMFAQYLYTYPQPDPDLIIRTGGEKRLSGYLLWQCEYSELYFTDTLWPDFDTKAFDSALEDFACRQRRFGG